MTGYPAITGHVAREVARALGTAAEPKRILQQLAASEKQIVSAGDHAAEHGERGLQVLRQMLRQHHPWQTPTGVLEQFSSARTQRSLARATARDEARSARPGSTDDLAPAFCRTQTVNLAGPATLRPTRPLHWAVTGLLLSAGSAAAQGPGAQWGGTDQVSLLPGTASALSPLACRNLAIGTIITTGVVTTVNMARMLLHHRVPGNRVVPAVGQAVTLPPLEHLQLEQDSDGHSLLDNVMWQVIAEGGTADELLQSVSSMDETDLGRLMGNRTALDAWLRTMVQLNGAEPDALEDTAEVAAASTAAGRLRRSATVTATPLNTLLGSCEAIKPHLQPLQSIEQSTRAVCSSSALANLPAEERSAFASCLLRIRSDVSTITAQLQAQRAQYLQADTVVPAVDMLATMSLTRLIARTEAISTRLRNAQLSVNQQLLQTSG